MMDLSAQLRIAEQVCDGAERLFLDGFGADPARWKESGDFATEVDMAIEEHLRQALHSASGIPVYGEEQGGTLTADAVWVVDPIDGTANYSVQNPLCAILISLLVDGQPVLGLTSLPMLSRRLAAYEGSPLLINGKPTPRLTSGPGRSGQVGFSSVASQQSSSFPSLVRQGLLGDLAGTFLRPRITGSVGVDLGFCAQGVFSGAVSFSPHVWDNAAGIVLNRAAGARITDIHGEPWSLESEGCVVGSPEAHDAIMTTMRSVLKA